MSQLDDADSFISAARRVRGADDLRVLMEAITREMGFDSYSLFQHVRHWSWQRTDSLALSNAPRGWVEQFFDRKYHVQDPVLQASMRTAVPFTWDQLDQLIDLSALQREIREIGRQAGLADGVSIPSHIPGESTGTCNFMVADGRALPVANLHLAQVIGSYAYEAARQIWLRKEGIVRRDPIRLTPRQLECIVEVGRGKSDGEIATIMGLSVGTVRGYVDDAKRLFGTTRRSLLVSRAVFSGHITLADTLS